MECAACGAAKKTTHGHYYCTACTRLPKAVAITWCRGCSAPFRTREAPSSKHCGACRPAVIAARIRAKRRRQKEKKAWAKKRPLRHIKCEFCLVGFLSAQPRARRCQGCRKKSKQAVQAPRACAVCRRPYTPSNRGRPGKTCGSPQCRKIAHARWEREWSRVKRKEDMWPCLSCGAVIAPKVADADGRMSSRPYCCDACKKARAAERNILAYAVTQAQRNKVRRNNAKSRARKEGKPKAVRDVLAKIAELSGIALDIRDGVYIRDAPRVMGRKGIRKRNDINGSRVSNPT